MAVMDQRRGTVASENLMPSRHGKRGSWLLAIAVGATVLGLVAFPFSSPSGSMLLTLSSIFMWIALASSWNIISGFTGYIDFGHAVFFGLGGYISGILMSRYDWSVWLTLPVAFVGALLFALLVGAPLLRLRGVYFSIAMLGAFMTVRQLLRISPRELTGGAAGLTLPPILNRELFYYVFLAAAVLVVLVVTWLRKSQLGYSMLAIREDEEGAVARGINTTAVKMTAFCASATITAVLGSMWAYQTTFIDPNIVFRDIFLVNLALMTVLGGLGTVWGPVLGATFFMFVRNTAWANLAEFDQLFFGAFLILIVLFMPEGVIGTVQRGDRTVLGLHIQRLRRRFARARQA